MRRDFPHGKKVYRRLVSELVEEDPAVRAAEEARPSHLYEGYGFTVADLDRLAGIVRRADRHEIREALFDGGVKLDAVSSVCERLFGARPPRKTPELHGGMTEPERIVGDDLENMGAPHTYNVRVIASPDGEGDGIAWFVDFEVGDRTALAKVQGDFWHANTDVYKESELLPNQREQVNRDRIKKRQIESTYPQTAYVTIWETDIRRRTARYEEAMDRVRSAPA